MNLYQLHEGYLNLVEVLENAGEDENLRELVTNSLNEIEDNIKDKADNVVRFIRNLESEANAIKEEEKRLAEMRKKREKQVENLKQYLFDFTKVADGQKIKGSIFTVSIKKNPASVVVDDLEAIPEEYKRVKTVIEADKTLLKKVLKDGEVAGVHLEQKESLNIK